MSCSIRGIILVAIVVGVILLVLFYILDKFNALDSNNKFIIFVNTLSGLTAIFAIIISIIAYNQIRFLNRPIAKIIIPQLIDDFPDRNFLNDKFQIQIHNRGESPLTEVKIQYKIISFEGNKLINEQTESNESYIDVLDEKDAKGFTTDFQFSYLKDPYNNWLFVIVGVKSPDFFGKKHKITIFYGHLGNKQWWEIDEKVDKYNLSDEHRLALKDAIKKIKKELEN